jgi:hypothetical protein
MKENEEIAVRLAELLALLKAEREERSRLRWLADFRDRLGGEEPENW